MKIEGSGSASGSESGSISQRHGSADPDPDPHQKCHGSGTLLDGLFCRWEEQVKELATPPSREPLLLKMVNWTVCFAGGRSRWKSWPRPPAVSLFSSKWLIGRSVIRWEEQVKELATSPSREPLLLKLVNWTVCLQVGGAGERAGHAPQTWASAPQNG